jgi:hypothetical protein
MDSPIEMHVDFGKAFEIIDEVEVMLLFNHDLRVSVYHRIQEVKRALGYDAYHRALSLVREGAVDTPDDRVDLRDANPG